MPVRCALNAPVSDKDGSPNEEISGHFEDENAGKRTFRKQKWKSAVDRTQDKDITERNRCSIMNETDVDE